MTNLYIHNRLEMLKEELKVLMAAEQLAMNKLKDIQIDIDTVKEDIRLEIEHNYHI